VTAERQQYHFPPELYYEGQTRLWVRVEAEIATIGLSALALEIFGDIVYISTIEAGKSVERGQVIGSIEAAKMVDDLVAPISGEILAFNKEVQRNPGVINADPYDGGWLIRVKPSAWDRDSAALIHGPALEPWMKEQLGRLEQSSTNIP
jgi:glycine cleavage system H protein